MKVKHALVKRILSILEVILYNLFPAVIVAPIILLLKDVSPIIAISVAKSLQYVAIILRKLYDAVYYKLPVKCYAEKLKTDLMPAQKAIFCSWIMKN